MRQLKDDVKRSDNARRNALKRTEMSVELKTSLQAANNKTAALEKEIVLLKKSIPGVEIRNQLALLRAEVNQISSQQSVDNRGRKRKYCQDETSDDDIVAIKRPSKQSTTISSLTTIRPSFEERQANREAER